MTRTCIAPHCALPDQHVPGCTTDCRGCLPAIATHGRLCQICYRSTDTALAAIARITPALAAALATQRRGEQRVSGTPGRPIPINVDAHDLDAPARPGAVHDELHDQTGQPSVATVLVLWSRWWAELLGHTPPRPTVHDLVEWLRNRLDWAAEHHPAVDDFITEIRDLRRRLRAVVDLPEPEPERCRGVPCRHCDQRNLYRRPDGSGDVDCHSCGLIYRPDEYAAWVALVAAQTGRVAQATRT